MRVSVIIPSYKPGDYLWDCLHSLIKQSLCKNNYEVILVLNGPKEPYYSAIGDFIDSEMKDVIVSFLYTAECGVSNARNIGLNIAKGEYIAFVDDDDIVSESYLEGLLAKASIDTVSISYTESFTQFIRTSNPNYVLTKEYMNKSIKGRISFYNASRFFQGPCMKLFHRSIISDRRYNTSFKNGEDSLFMFLISDRIKYVDFTDLTSIYYRRIRNDGANYSKKTFVYKCKNSFRLVKEYVKIFIKKPTNYSFSFFLSRLCGAAKAGLLG